MIKRIAVVVNSVVADKSMGGGDRIFIELSKDWQKRGLAVTLVGPREAQAVAALGGLASEFRPTFVESSGRLSIIKTYLKRIFKALFEKSNYGAFDLIYSASEALTDVVLSLRIRRQNPKALWLVGFFLRAPNPFRAEVPFNFKFVSLFLQQQLSLWLLKAFGVSGLVLLGKEEEVYLSRRHFINLCRILGGVDRQFINALGPVVKEYEACFVGRLSYQKGVDDLLTVWQRVMGTQPRARLAIIGWGDDEGEKKFRQEIERKGLAKNIDFLGFQEGLEKFRVMASAKLMILPSRYESFGIVFLEALAAGVPVVAYDLPVLKENFSQGVVFLPPGQVEEMAQKVIELLGRPQLLRELSLAGLGLSQEFSWSKTTEKVFRFIVRLAP